MKPTLKGLRILNTRPQPQAQELSQQIRAAGGLVLECPTLEIQGLSEDWIEHLPDLNEVQQAIFISAPAVHYCYHALNTHQLTWPSQIKVIAIGQATTKKLKEFGISVHFMPEQADSERLLEIDSLKNPKDQKLLLFKGEQGRTLIETELLKREAKLFSLAVYKRVIPQIPKQFINSLWQDDLVDIILLTSEQSIQHLFKMFPDKAHAWLQSKTCLVLSERLAKVAAGFGIQKLILSHPNKMMDALLDRL